MHEIGELTRARLHEIDRAFDAGAVGGPAAAGQSLPQLRDPDAAAAGSRRRQPHEMLLIEPIQLRIEHGVSAADPLERKSRDQLVAREDFLVVARRPAEQREEVSIASGR